MDKIIEINFTQDVCGHFDFGNFPSKKKMKISRNRWSDYLDKRRAFEEMHHELIKMTKDKPKFPTPDMDEVAQEVFRQLEPWGVRVITIDGIPYGKK